MYNRMKYFIASLFLMALLHPCAAQQGGNVYMFSYFKDNGQDGLHLAYSMDGLSWLPLHNDSSLLTPAVAKDKLMRDPCIIRGADNTFHMVWTVSWNDGGIGYASSPDLVHWSEQRFIPVMKDEPTARNCWAPEIFYNRASKQYMIYWATTIPGRFMAGDTAGDDKYNHRMYYTLTKDFKTFSPTKLLYDKGFNVIDATIRQEGKRFIMFLKDETKKPPQKNIRVAFSNTVNGGYSVPSAPITGNYWAEGPTVARINGQWIVYFDKYTQHSYGAVSSPDLKTWTDISDQVKFPAGARHGTVFTVSRKEFEQLNR
jgi:Glycosyl hydrolases family 43